MSNMNKKVLLICYYFPPLGGAGVGRPLGLYKHLPEFGYDCDLLTVKPVTYRLYEPELLHDLDESRIYRSGSFDPQRFMYLLGLRKIKGQTIARGKSASEKFFPDPKVGWVKPALKLGRNLISNNNYKAIISTSPPVSTHLIGRQLSMEGRIPWIADFRDYWMSYPLEECYNDKKLIDKAKTLLQEIKDKATIITTVNDTLASYFGDAKVIMNSFDQSLAREWQPTLPQKEFTIGLFGTFDEIYPIEPLLKMLSMFRDKYPENFARIKLQQIGNVNRQWLVPLLNKYQLYEKTLIHGFLPRLKAVQQASKSQMFYLGLPSEKEKGFTTGRIFLLMASGRPLLAHVTDDSEVAKLIRGSNNGYCFTGDLSRAVEYLNEFMLKSAANKLPTIILSDYARQYSAENMAKKFAGLIQKLENTPWSV